MRSHKTAMSNLATAAKQQQTADEYARQNRRPHPLDALSTAKTAGRYATHEKCHWTETPDGKPLARPILCQESDGFLRDIEPVKEFRMPERKYRTVSEVAEMLEVSRTAVDGAIARGELHAFSPFKVKRILLAELIRYLRERGCTPEEITDVTQKWEASLAVVAPVETAC